MSKRSFFTSLRRAMALSMDDWAALNTAFPSNIAIAKVAIFTGTMVVGAQGVLMTIQSKVLALQQATLETGFRREMTQMSSKLETDINGVTSEMNQMSSKLSSIEVQLEHVLNELAQKPKS